MRTPHESTLTPRWIVFGTALVYFALGSVLTAQFMHMKEAWADSHRVLQLKIHHVVPSETRILKERMILCNRALRIRSIVRSEPKANEFRR